MKRVIRKIIGMPFWIMGYIKGYIKGMIDAFKQIHETMSKS